MAKLTVLVTGATGQQGGRVARLLLDHGHTVHALTRHPDSDAARDLQRRGARVIASDMTDRRSLENHFRNMDAVYAMTTPFEGGVGAEVAQGIAMADAAHAVGVPHFLYSSVGSADQNTGIPHFESKLKVERRLQELNLPHTIVAPVWWMENVRAPWHAPLRGGQLTRPLPPDRKLQQLALPTLAEFMVLVLEDPDRFLGKRLDLASDELTGREEAEILSRVIGEHVEFVQAPIEAVRAQNEDFALMFEWFDRVGYSAHLTALRREYPQVAWPGYEEWAKTQDWSQVTGKQLSPA